VQCRGCRVATHQGPWSTPCCRPTHCGPCVYVPQARSDRALFLAHRLGVSAACCRKVRCVGNIQTLDIRHATACRAPNARQSHFATALPTALAAPYPPPARWPAVGWRPARRPRGGALEECPVARKATGVAQAIHPDYPQVAWLPTVVIVICAIVVSALAPCQCRSPALICTTSPTWISRCSCSVAT
jgi:hypothetical protein